MYGHVIWPGRHDPKTSPIYALDDIDVRAPPEVIWKLLVAMPSRSALPAKRPSRRARA